VSTIAWTRRRRAVQRNWSLYRRDREGIVGLLVLAVFVAVAVFASVIADPEDLRAITADVKDYPRWAPPSEFAPLGTDSLGRPVWDQLVYGSQVSLIVGIAATAIAILIGTVVGVLAGFFGGWIDACLSRLTEWFLVIPFLPLAIVLAAVLGPSLRNIIFVIGVTSWPVTARLIRAQVLTIKQRLYVERSKALGASSLHVMGRHVLPNVMPLVIANATLTVPVAILSETALAFLGLGDPTRISWGSMLEDSFDAGALGREAWWWYLPPGLCVIGVVLAFTLIGRALEGVLDPRLRDRHAVGR
jgi:peptide/nickel transport system permease protein